MIKMKDDKAQMMVLESILFAITVVVALAFLVQISPTSIQGSSQSSNELKILGDDALDTIYAETLHIIDNPGGGYTTNNPTSKLAVCIITNDYTELTGSLSSILPETVLYNIYVSNGPKTVFWCASSGDTDNRQLMIDPVAISHHPISIDPIHLNDFSDDTYNPDGGTRTQSDIWEHFVIVNFGDVVPVGQTPYYGSTYEVILEMSHI